MYKGVGVRFDDCTNYFIFIGYLKTWDGKGVQANPLWIRHWSSVLVSDINGLTVC